MHIDGTENNGSTMVSCNEDNSNGSNWLTGDHSGVMYQLLQHWHSKSNACSLVLREIVITNIKETVLEDYWELDEAIQHTTPGYHLL